MSPRVIASAWRSLERFLLPNACICCESLVSDARPDDLLCAVCRSRMRPVAGGCPRCHHPMPPVGPCRFCVGWTPNLRTVQSAVWMGPEARALVHHLKYGFARRLAEVAAAIVTRSVERPNGGIVIPTPATVTRLRERGYNQAELIARAVATAWHLPSSAVLTRHRQVRSQTALTPEARQRNVAGAFSATPPSQPGRKGRSSTSITAILVDDVLTTGATLDACAAALVAAGWEDVVAVTFARALPYEVRVLAT